MTAWTRSLMQKSMLFPRHRSILSAAVIMYASAFASATAFGEALRVGVAVPLSGPSARVGDEASKVARWWATKMKAEQGLDVEVVVRDTTFKPADAVAAVERRLVLEDKVHAITGMWHSAQGIATVPVMKRLGVPLVLMGSSSPKVMHGPDNANAKDFAWRASIDDIIKGNLVGQFLVETVAPKFTGPKRSSTSARTLTLPKTLSKPHVSTWISMAKES